jgi:mRNA interferase MazF
VVVLSRPDAIAVLHTVVVAPVTSTIRGAPSEVLVGIDEGLKHDSAVNLDHVQTVEQARLRRQRDEHHPDPRWRTGAGPQRALAASRGRGETA